MNTIPQLVAVSNATADIAYYVCIVSFFIAGGVAIFLLWDRIQHHKQQGIKRVSRARTATKTTTRKPVKKAAAKKTVAKKVPAKKAPVRKTATKKTTKRTTKK